mgnify:CR=1 FL=1
MSFHEIFNTQGPKRNDENKLKSVQTTNQPTTTQQTNTTVTISTKKNNIKPLMRNEKKNFLVFFALFFGSSLGKPTNTHTPQAISFKQNIFGPRKLSTNKPR